MSEEVSNEVLALVDDAMPWERDTREFLEAIGGSWDVQHDHDFNGLVLPCRPECRIEHGTHIRRHVWRSDPI